ncbi:MAG: copper resistance protein B [Sphingobium sp.]|jgi:copper resistance protein B|nr:copper resistance protein B [Sphingobium sp.]
MKTILLAAVAVLVLPVPALAQGDTQSMPGMDMGAPGDTAIGSAPAPAPPDDHAADVLFDPAEMARARAGLRKENGAFNGSMVLFDLAEVQIRNGRNGYRWEGEAWFGGDIDRLQIKSEGAGNFGERTDDVEVQALWSRAVSPFFNAQLGVRHDIVPNPSRTYAVAGVEGIAPNWFRVTGQVFLSNKGEFLARLEGGIAESGRKRTLRL